MSIERGGGYKNIQWECGYGPARRSGVDEIPLVARTSYTILGTLASEWSPKDTESVETTLLRPYG